jgi:hypothetical protein
MRRTSWFFTMGAVWYAPVASKTMCYVFGLLYTVFAFWSWYRESKHKEEVRV